MGKPSKAIAANVDHVLIAYGPTCDLSEVSLSLSFYQTQNDIRILDRPRDIATGNQLEALIRLVVRW